MKKEIKKKICVVCMGLVSLAPSFSVVSADSPSICPGPVPTNVSLDNEFGCSDAEETQSFFNSSSAFSGSSTSGALVGSQLGDQIALSYPLFDKFRI